ncbi:hypothetical protein AHAS_Ahas06G0089600 [Arachis hypogaea]
MLGSKEIYKSPGVVRTGIENVVNPVSKSYLNSVLVPPTVHFNGRWEEYTPNLPLPLTFREIVAAAAAAAADRLELGSLVTSDEASPSYSSMLLFSETLWISTWSTAPPVLNMSRSPIAANEILEDRNGTAHTPEHLISPELKHHLIAELCHLKTQQGNNIATPTRTGDLSYEIDIRGTNGAGESARRCIMDADPLLYLTPSSTLAVKCTHYSRVFVQVPYFEIGEEAIESGPSG